MTRETKVGLSLAGTVFVLVGGALVYKLYYLRPTGSQLAEKPTTPSSAPQVVPAKSESSSAPNAASSVEDKPAPFQGEIRNNPETTPPSPSTASGQPGEPTTARSDLTPPPPAIIIENKPPMALPEADKVPVSGDVGGKPKESSPQTPGTIPPPPPTSPSPSTPPPAITSPPTASTVPAPVNPPSPADVNKPTSESKPADTASIANPPTPSASPVAIVPNPSDPPAGNVPAPPALSKPEMPPPTKPDTSSVAPSRGEPGNHTEPGGKPANNLPPASPASTPTLPVVVPTPPPSDAFDRSYSAPPSPTSLVANRESKPRPDDAIPITIRPQTQPLAPPPPDGYPVKVAPPNRPSEQVEVLDYEVHRYTVRPGDTWETISRWKYGSTSFAPALATYNRERDPRLTQLSAGSTVFLPPGEILQRRYPHLFGSKPSSTTGSASLATQPSTPPITPAAPAASSPANSSQYKLYRVQPNDTMWLIAKRTLGSGDRWPEIFRLNRDVLQDVNQLSPGTVLRLPPDARVDNTAAP